MVCSKIFYIVQQYISPSIHNKIKKLPSPREDLVVHMRCGDIFQKTPGDLRDSNYIQNPLKYYIDLFNNYKSVRIVTEANFRQPPLIPVLIDKYPSCIIQSSTLLNDFGTLVKAKNLASSGVGTFAIAAALASNSIKKFHCTNLYLTEHLNPDLLRINDLIKVKINFLESYIPIGGWVNTPSQIKSVLNHGLTQQRT